MKYFPSLCVRFEHRVAGHALFSGPWGPWGFWSVHLQTFWLPAKSSISLALEVLSPSTFFLPSETNVPDGICFQNKAQIHPDWKFTL